MPEQLEQKIVLLNGKLITAVPGVLIGENFKTLQNLRYTDQSVAGIRGMSKINTTAITTYTNIKNGYNFIKASPAENFTFLQVRDSSEANPRLYSSTTAIPSQGDFTATLTEDTSAGLARFSNTPTGGMAVCDGVNSYLYLGDEAVCSQFINLDYTGGTFQYDYTERVTNTLQDAANVATLKRVVLTSDADTMLLLHLDGNVTDSSPATPHTVTNTNVTLNSTAKFGTFSAGFNGTNAYLTVPDNADFDFSAGNFCIDAWVYPSSFTATRPVYSQQTDANNYMLLYIEATTGKLTFVIYAASAEVVRLQAPGSLTLATMQHIEVDEDGDNWYLFVNGALVASDVDTSRAANYTGTAQIGGYSGDYFYGRIDEFRVSDVTRHTAAFSPPTSAYGAENVSSIYLGSIMPLDGFKLYVSTPNASAATLACFYWDGESWQPVSSLVDGTDVGGISLAQTGSVTFTSTATTAKVRVINETLLYWYLVTVSGSTDDNIGVYYTTLNTPVQPIKDIWDGDFRTCFSFQKYTTVYSDLTINVVEEDYSSVDTASYANISSLTSAQALYAGFVEPVTALDFNIVGGSENSTANTVATISYWNGTAWVAVSGKVDGTVTSNISFAKSGIISWAHPEGLEFTTSIAKQIPLYYYKITFNKTLDADVKLDSVKGIPAQVSVLGYRFPVLANNRLFLCSEVAGNENSVLALAANSSNVANGLDSTILYFGDNTALTAGVQLYSQFGSQLFNLTLLTKDTQTWVLAGSTPEDWRQYPISEEVGCPAPLTMKVATVAFEIAPEATTRRVAIWQGAEGIYVSDGRVVKPVHSDIADIFDRRNSYAINRDKIGDSVSFVDDLNFEYHWLFASGASTVLDKEFVLDLKRFKWYEIVRTGNALQCGWTSSDTNGNKYAFGGLNTGYVERLENGNTFDGTDITHTLQVGDISLEGPLVETEIRKIKLGQVAKTTTANSVTITHYGNTKTAGTTATVSPVKSGYTISDVLKGQGWGPFITHSIKAVLVTNDEAKGFEPLYLGFWYRICRQDMT